MTNSANQIASATTQKAMDLENRQFQLGLQGITAGTDYLNTTYKAGTGAALLDPKFAAMKTDALESSAQGTGNMGDISAMLQARALGQSGVANQRLTAGLDEINKLRSLLANHGLKTTGLSQQGQGESLEALSLMPKNPALSTALGVGAAAAGVYGGLKQPGTPGTGPSATSIAPLASGSFLGSDTSILQGGGPQSFSLFGGGPGYFDYQKAAG